MPSSLSAASSNVTWEAIKEWFAATREYIERIDGGRDALRDPKRVYNCDESGFPLNGNIGRVKAVLAKKGAKHVMKRERGTKIQITVLGCANAAGDFMSPYLVYPGQLMTVRMGYENFQDAIYTQTDNGWMDADSFFEFICYFDAWITKMKIVRPVILWVDGHVSHLAAQTARFCRVNGIILFVLLGNATFIIQPFDVGIFSELKQAWVSAVHDFTKDDLSRLITKGTFSRVFKMAWDAITGSSEKAIRIASNAFRRFGIFPFDPEAVDYLRLITNLNEQEREEEHQMQKLIQNTIEHEPNPNAYTLSGSGKVNDNETIVEPAEAAVPFQRATEPADGAKSNEYQNKPRNENQNKPQKNQTKLRNDEIKNLTEARNNKLMNDPDRVTEVNPRTGDELLCVQPRVSVKTEDGTEIASVPPVMIPVKRGPQYVSEAAKKLKEKEAEVTRTLEEKNRKRKQGSENIRRYVSKAQSGNEALEYFAKKG